MDQKELNTLRSKLQLASQHLGQGRIADAGSLYDEVDALAGQDSVLNVELGHLSTKFGNYEKAAKHYFIAHQNEPGNIEYACHFGFSLLRGGNLDNAKTLFEAVLKQNPDYPQALYGMGIVHLELYEFERAAEYLARASGELKKDPKVFLNLAIALMGLNDYEQALEMAVKALKLDPSSEATNYTIGRIYTESGNREAAVRQFEKIINKYEFVGIAYENLSRLKKFTESDAPFIRKAEKALKKGMPSKDRTSLHFALGKMYDDCGAYDTAYDHYTRGNLLQKSAYDYKRDRKWYKLLRRNFTRKSIETLGRHGNESGKPVFIVGMPRTGTTLMERIIANHSRAAGAGELQTMPQIARSALAGEKVQSLEDIRGGLSPENLSHYAGHYLASLERGQGDAERIVDKLPGNYQYIGLIASLFPNATIIHAVRHPLDTCLSCYFQVFGHLNWANDLETIASTYRLYRDYMAYWTHVLPEGKILDVHYELLTENPEPEARRMIEHCGLDWEPGCLDYHKRDSVVKTVSLWQVRQPIYGTSRMRWKNYASHLGELAASLGDYLQEDRQALEELGISLKARRSAWFGRR